MKIAIDVSQLVYGTGVGSYTENLVKALLKIDKKNEYLLIGYSLRLGSKFKQFEEQLKPFKNFKFKFFPLPITLAGFLFNKIRFYPFDKLIGPVDIFHSSDWIQPPIKSSATKKVTTVHDMVPFLFENSTHPRIISTQKKRFKLLKEEIDIILADSKTTKEDIIKFAEIPTEKIKVVYLGVSSSFKPQDEDRVSEILEKYKIKKPYILSVATQEPRKNIQKLIDVFEKINETYQNLTLVLVGKYGWGTEINVIENIQQTGYVPEEDLPALYSGARLFVYPSLYEGFGLPILEAMACGVPVITSNNSSMAEIAKDAAILIDPRNEQQMKKAIEMILSLNLENYQKMVRASMERAREYSWTKTARQTLEVYEELFSRKD